MEHKEEEPYNSSNEDYTDDGDEDSDAYRTGGYHPVHLGDMFAKRYLVVEKLGWGHFSTVWMCRDTSLGNSPCTRKYVALKIQKSATHYRDAAFDEIELLNSVSKASASEAVLKEHGSDFDPPVVMLLDHFEHTGPHGRHVCMVFESLGENLLKVIKNYEYQGMSIPVVQNFTRQILLGLDFLHRHCKIIHTDLKPENVLVAICPPPPPDPVIANGTAKTKKKITKGKKKSAESKSADATTSAEQRKKNKKRAKKKRQRARKTEQQKNATGGSVARRHKAQIPSAEKELEMRMMEEASEPIALKKSATPATVTSDQAAAPCTAPVVPDIAISPLSTRLQQMRMSSDDVDGSDDDSETGHRYMISAATSSHLRPHSSLPWLQDSLLSALNFRLMEECDRRGTLMADILHPSIRGQMQVTAMTADQWVIPAPHLLSTIHMVYTCSFFAFNLCILGDVNTYAL